MFEITILTLKKYRRIGGIKLMNAATFYRQLFLGERLLYRRRLYSWQPRWPARCGNQRVATRPDVGL